MMTRLLHSEYAALCRVGNERVVATTAYSNARTFERRPPDSFSTSTVVFLLARGSAYSPEPN